MKVRFYVSLGSAMTTSEDIIEIPDEDIKGYDKYKIDEYLRNYLNDWLSNEIEYGYNVVDKK